MPLLPDPPPFQARPAGQARSDVTYSCTIPRAPHEGLNWRSYGLAFGDRIRDLRHHRDLTQEQLAEASGVSRNIISAIETNAHHRGTPANPRLDTVYRLALGLRVPPGALIPDVDRLVSPEPSSSRAGADADLAWPERYHAFTDVIDTRPPRT